MTRKPKGLVVTVHTCHEGCCVYFDPQPEAKDWRKAGVEKIDGKARKYRMTLRRARS